LKLLSPTYLIALAFLQVAIAYLTNMEVTAEQYSVTLNYFPLLLWFMAFIFVILGDRIAVFLFRRPGSMRQANIRFLESLNRMKLSRLDFLYLVAVIGLLAYAGGIPLFSIITGSREIAELNEAQNDALPGLYGIHAMLIVLMEYCLGLLILKSILLNNKSGVKILIGSIVVFIATIIEGKRQGLAIFICLLGVTLLASLNLRPGNSQGYHKQIFRIFVGVALFAFLALAFVTYVRLDAGGHGEDTIIEPLRYLSLPLINLESLSAKASWGGLEMLPLKPLDLLIPAKLGFERGMATIPVPEPTSPYGFFAMAYLYWGGVFGLSMYALAVGVFSGFMFYKAKVSPLFLLFYSFIVWSLLMAHTYNHFLTITFIPLQFFLLLIVKFVVFKVPFRRTQSPPFLP
jgi:oligosaccharide repeat unit polymerase